jgi:hypothetical protein
MVSESSPAHGQPRKGHRCCDHGDLLGDCAVVHDSKGQTYEWTAYGRWWPAGLECIFCAHLEKMAAKAVGETAPWSIAQNHIQTSNQALIILVMS